MIIKYSSYPFKTRKVRLMITKDFVINYQILVIISKDLKALKNHPLATRVEIWGK